MERKLRIVQIGFGNMGKVISRYAMESGCEIVGVFVRNPVLFGRDISTVLGTEPVGTVFSDVKRFDELVDDMCADCAVIATKSLMSEIRELLLLCAAHGLNVVTTCDEAVYPWNSAPDISREVDIAAKAGGCTILGAGFPDWAYCHQLCAAAGAARNIKKINGVASYNVDEFGAILAQHHGVGLSAEMFDREFAAADRMSDEERRALIASGRFAPMPMWNVNGWICERLGLTVVSQRQESIPCFAGEELFSVTLGRTIRVGETTGMTGRAITKTAEGVEIVTDAIGKVYAAGEHDINEWSITADTDIYVVNPRLGSNTSMVCALIVSRIADAMNARSGLICSSELSPARYLAGPVCSYVL